MSAQCFLSEQIFQILENSEHEEVPEPCFIHTAQAVMEKHLSPASYK